MLQHALQHVARLVATRVWCALDWIYKLMLVGAVVLAYVLYVTYLKLRKEVTRCRPHGSRLRHAAHGGTARAGNVSVNVYAWGRQVGASESGH
jgi:hypothetical protein